MTWPTNAKTLPATIVEDAAWIAREAASTVRDAMSHAITWKFAAALVLWFIVAASLSACGQSDLRQSARSIGLGQFQQTDVADRFPDLSRDTSDPGRERLATAPLRVPETDQELLAQGAIAAGLERDAGIAREIEEARRQILARAYIDRVAAAAPPATAPEIREFYEGHPALFARRRIYRVLELEVSLTSERFGDLQDAVVAAKDLAAIARWLDRQQLSFEATMFSRTAEQMPMDVLQRASGMRDGEIAVFPVPGGASVMWLVQSTQAPLSMKQARTSIGQYLIERRRAELALTEVGNLRELASAGRDADSPHVTSPPMMQMTAELQTFAPAQGGAIDRHVEAGNFH